MNSLEISKGLKIETRYVLDCINKAVLYADRLYMEQEIHNRSLKLGRFSSKWKVESTVYRLAVRDFVSRKWFIPFGFR